MGLDVELYAEGPISDEEIVRANALFEERSMALDYNDTYVGRSEYDPNRVERFTLARYYGEGYERGDWPTIFSEIVLMTAAFPNAVIHYGSDTYADAPEVTGERMDELWMHWAGNDGVAYRRMWRAINDSAQREP